MRLGLRRAGRALLLLLASCRTAQAQGAPAVIVHPTAESRAALEQAVGAALGGAPVALAHDALTRESELAIERRRARDPSGRLAQGRERGLPERFRLVKDGATCVLVHERTEARYPLAGTECAAR